MRKINLYPNYKFSNHGWLGNIPSHWEIKKLKYLFQIKKTIAGKLGYSVLSITQKGIKVKDIESGAGQLAMDYSKYQLVDIGYFAMNHMDLLTGYVDISKYHGVISPDYRVFILKGKKNYDRYFLYLLQLCYSSRIFYALGQGSSQFGRWRLAAEEFNTFEFPCPTESEQKSIVRFLDRKSAEIKSFIQLKEKTISLLIERKNSLIKEAITFGINKGTDCRKIDWEWLPKMPAHWELKPLKAFIDFINRGNTPNYVDSSDIKVVNQATFSKGYWDEREIRFHKEIKSDQPRGMLKHGDVLLASTGGGVLGKVGYFEDKDGRYMADSHVTILRDTKNRICSKYYFYWLDLNFDLINGLLAQGSTNQTELQRDWLRGFYLPYPPIEEQKQIAFYLDQITGTINDTINQARREITIIKEYQQSIISEAVTGKIDVRKVSVSNQAQSYSHHEV